MVKAMREKYKLLNLNLFFPAFVKLLYFNEVFHFNRKKLFLIKVKRHGCIISIDEICFY